jgi:hypothetical protein
MKLIGMEVELGRNDVSMRHSRVERSTTTNCHCPEGFSFLCARSPKFLFLMDWGRMMLGVKKFRFLIRTVHLGHRSDDGEGARCSGRCVIVTSWCEGARSKPVAWNNLPL